MEMSNQEVPTKLHPSTIQAEIRRSIIKDNQLKYEQGIHDHILTKEELSLAVKKEYRNRQGKDIDVDRELIHMRLNQVASLAKKEAKKDLPQLERAKSTSNLQAIYAYWIWKQEQSNPELFASCKNYGEKTTIAKQYYHNAEYTSTFPTLEQVMSDQEYQARKKRTSKKSIDGPTSELVSDYFNVARISQPVREWSSPTIGREEQVETKPIENKKSAMKARLFGL